jgi:hypothetical protein
MKISLHENIERIKSLLYVNEQAGSAPCKQPNQIKTTSGETELMGYILNVLDDNNINLRSCKDKKCIDDKMLAEKIISELLNALVDKRDLGTELNPENKKNFDYYTKVMRGIFPTFNKSHYNRGTCAMKSKVSIKTTTTYNK